MVSGAEIIHRLNQTLIPKLRKSDHLENPGPTVQRPSVLTALFRVCDCVAARVVLLLEEALLGPDRSLPVFAGREVGGAPWWSL